MSPCPRALHVVYNMHIFTRNMVINSHLQTGMYDIHQNIIMTKSDNERLDTSVCIY